jgi:hypothetical protein
VETTVDFIGIIKEAFPVSSITMKATGEQKARRNLLIFDLSKVAIEFVPRQSGVQFT